MEDARKRFTPTGVGTILRNWRIHASRSVHPHGRGDDALVVGWLLAELRFTPTGVWTIGVKRFASRLLLVHPHGRGDDEVG